MKNANRKFRWPRAIPIQEHRGAQRYVIFTFVAAIRKLAAFLAFFIFSYLKAQTRPDIYLRV